MEMFDENYKSLVVLANPKTVLNVKYATKDVKEKIVRADQLIAKIKELDAKVQDVELCQKTMEEIANALLEKNIEERSDYAKKYEDLLAKMESNIEPVPEVIEKITKEPKVENNREEIVKKLKAFRLEQSKKEKSNHTIFSMMHKWKISLRRTHTQKRNYLWFQDLAM